MNFLSQNRCYWIRIIQIMKDTYQPRIYAFKDRYNQQSSSFRLFESYKYRILLKLIEILMRRSNLKKVSILKKMKISTKHLKSLLKNNLSIKIFSKSNKKSNLQIYMNPEILISNTTVIISYTFPCTQTKRIYHYLLINRIEHFTITSRKKEAISPMIIMKKVKSYRNY